VFHETIAFLIKWGCQFSTWDEDNNNLRSALYNFWVYILERFPYK